MNYLLDHQVGSSIDCSCRDDSGDMLIKSHSASDGSRNLRPKVHKRLVIRVQAALARSFFNLTYLLLPPTTASSSILFLPWLLSAER